MEKILFAIFGILLLGIGGWLLWRLLGSSKTKESEVEKFEPLGDTPVAAPVGGLLGDVASGPSEEVTVFGETPISSASTGETAPQSPQSESAYESAEPVSEEVATSASMPAAVAPPPSVKAAPEKKLTQSDDILFATLSHELRTPLNGILGMIQLMRSELQDERMGVVEAGARHMLSLLENLVNLKKVQEGKLEEYREWVSPKEIAEELRKNLRFRAESRGLDLVVDHDENPNARVRADRAQLVSIFENLILASLEKSEVISRDENEQLSLKWRVSGEEMSLEIKNPLELYTKERLEKTENIFSDRTGDAQPRILIETLLWAVANGLIERSNGSLNFIEVPSGGVVTKAAFTFEQMNVSSNLTRAPMGNLSLRKDKDSLSGMNESLHILIAEDDPLNQRVLSYMLKKMGHRFTVSNNGQEAVEAVKADESIEMVLMDIDMPIVDGVGATQALRNGDAGPHGKTIPITAVTAFSSTTNQGQFRRSGMDFFIAKPISTETLRAVIWEVVSQRRQKVS
ncbi:response regulator [Rubellicoccus peritrichatus]|uniref:histidine kinase n=1 Tax=Rubellicoccus peritrichatus TaxID=3080537 RepID=A0AAQ3LCE2_9BACT|nr:response regulator [Puniceicoccus sp. CR14]WOO42777.1 response regulator [Puniceicoccus sp. CR14]